MRVIVVVYGTVVRLVVVMLIVVAGVVEVVLVVLVIIGKVDVEYLYRVEVPSVVVDLPIE